MDRDTDNRMKLFDEALLTIAKVANTLLAYTPPSPDALRSARELLDAAIEADQAYADEVERVNNE